MRYHHSDAPGLVAALLLLAGSVATGVLGIVQLGPPADRVTAAVLLVASIAMLTVAGLLFMLSTTTDPRRLHVRVRPGPVTTWSIRSRFVPLVRGRSAELRPHAAAESLALRVVGGLEEGRDGGSPVERAATALLRRILHHVRTAESTRDEALTKRGWETVRGDVLQFEA